MTLYRRLIALRRRHAALHAGAWRPLGVLGDTLAYSREHAGEALVVVLNFGAESAAPPDALPARARVLLSTMLDFDGEVTKATKLLPFEGWILSVGTVCDEIRSRRHEIATAAT